MLEVVSALARNGDRLSLDSRPEQDAIHAESARYCRSNAPEKRRYRGTEREIEIVRDGDALIMRRVVDWPKWRRLAAEVLANVPKSKKGKCGTPKSAARY